MGENKLYAVFDPEFIQEIETLGNSVVISKYRIEDIREEITNISDLLDNEDTYQYGDWHNLTGFWDLDRKELKVHISLPKGVFSWKVRDTGTSEDPENFEYSRDPSGNYDGDGLVRLIRFISGDDDSKTSFIVTGNIVTKAGKLVVEPIECNQDKLLLTIVFPETTQANIKAKNIEKDTKFLEGYGIMRGLNIFKTTDPSELASLLSTHEYYRYTTTDTKIWRKETPYVWNDGRIITRRDSFRLYTSLRIYCSNLITQIIPNTRASLNRYGGILKIYGEATYLDYEVRDTELVYTGTGTESIDGIPDFKLILTTHNDGLRDPDVRDKFFVSYGRYEGQSDPSVLVKGGIYFWNPFEERIEYIESPNIKLTQLEEVIPQWEIIYRSTSYTEPPDNTPVYLFPWKSGAEHYFTIRTTLPNLSTRDFEIIYENPILRDYFEYRIERRASRTYPITDYKVILRSIHDNLETDWLPIVNGESKVLLSTIKLRDYGFSESFYYVQAPKVPSIELHDQDNNNISEIVLAYNQTESSTYPIAPDARNQDEIGERNTWKVLDHDSNVEPIEEWGRLNPNNPDLLETRLNLRISASSDSVQDMDLGKIVLGRIKDSERRDIITRDWRSIVYLSTVNVPIIKRGIIERITCDESVVLREISLYKVKVTCNGPFACWMEPSNDYCFFNPQNNTLGTNHYYSEEFNATEGVYVYLALHDTIAQNEEPLEDGKILFTVTPEEPSWDERPDIFSDQSNLSECTIYRQAPEELKVSYVNPTDMYVFLGAYESNGIRYKSTETPTVDRLQMLDTLGIGDSLRFYNSITLLDSPTPLFTVEENYRYHIQHIQNPNDLQDYYPISPCCIYRAHSYNDSDIYKPFYIFRKALGPSFYRSDSSTSNTIFMVSDPSSESADRRKSITIRSRYEILESEFTTQFSVENGFEIENIVHTTLSSSTDYKHQYSITLNTLVQNTGPQRQLGVLSITSRIYNLINFTSYESTEVPYIELTQSDIDRIVTPATMRISIIQAAGNGGNTGEIEVIGNRESLIGASGEERSFTITSNIPIDIPEFTDILGCTMQNVGISGFEFKVPPRTENYTPVIPSTTTSYMDFTQAIPVSFSLLINPLDLETYQPYSEDFSFKQSGFTGGLIYGSPSNNPKLYLGQAEITELVNYDTTSLRILLGIFDIRRQIPEGARGITKGINIRTEDRFTILSDYCYYYNSRWTETVTLEFPQNLTGHSVSRVFTITYNDGEITHKLVVTIKQISGSGNIICSDNAYFLSHGECVETDSYIDDMGFFTFDTDLDIKTLSLNIPPSLYESYNFIYIGPSELGGNYSTYKAQIKLKPNLSNSIIEKQIFSFLKDGKSIKNVYINQGFYCFKLYYPESLNDYICSGGTMGSENNPILVPSQNNMIEGTRKVFKAVLERSEPIPSTGKYNYSKIDLSEGDIAFPMVGTYTWTSLSNSKNIIGSKEKRSIGEYLSSYSTNLFEQNQEFDYPFLENIYTVYQKYYNSEFSIKIDFSIIVNYPYSDPLYTFKKYTEHTYMIYIKKESEENTI